MSYFNVQQKIQCLPRPDAKKIAHFLFCVSLVAFLGKNEFFSDYKLVIIIIYLESFDLKAL